MEEARICDAHAAAYLPPSAVSFVSCWAAMIYYVHAIDGLSALAPSSPTYLVGLTTGYMYMYVLFTLIQLWSVSENRDP